MLSTSVRSEGFATLCSDYAELCVMPLHHMFLIMLACWPNTVQHVSPPGCKFFLFQAINRKLKLEIVGKGGEGYEAVLLNALKLVVPTQETGRIRCNRSHTCTKCDQIAQCCSGLVQSPSSRAHGLFIFHRVTVAEHFCFVVDVAARLGSVSFVALVA